MNPAETSTPGPRFRIALPVYNLGVSVEFYRRLFSVQPTEATETSARFELESPRIEVVLFGGRSKLFQDAQELGWNLPDLPSLERFRDHCVDVGILSHPLSRIYATPIRPPETSFDVTDPNGYRWKFRIEKLDTISVSKPAPSPGKVTTLGESPRSARQWNNHRASWYHFPDKDMTNTVPHPDNTLGLVDCVWSANTVGAAQMFPQLLEDAFRALAPGGFLRVHAMCTDLPRRKPASHTEALPPTHPNVVSHSEIRALLRAAGFAQIWFEEVPNHPNFEIEGIASRFMLVMGEKPGHRTAERTRSVIYLGPFLRVEDDFGNRFEKGVPVPVNTHDWQRLMQNPGRSAFAFLGGPLYDPFTVLEFPPEAPTRRPLPGPPFPPLPRTVPQRD